MTFIGLKILKSKKSQGLSVCLEKKSITIYSEGGVPAIEVTNEYGNSQVRNFRQLSL